MEFIPAHGRPEGQVWQEIEGGAFGDGMEKLFDYPRRVTCSMTKGFLSAGSVPVTKEIEVTDLCPLIPPQCVLKYSILALTE